MINMNNKYVNIALLVALPVLVGGTVVACLPPEFLPEPAWFPPSLYGEVIPPDAGNFCSVYRHQYIDKDGDEQTSDSNENYIESSQNTMLVEFSVNTNSIRVTAEPASGYEFDHWEVRTGIIQHQISSPYGPLDGSTEMSFVIPVEIDERVFVKAYFKEVPFPLEDEPSDWIPEDGGGPSDWEKEEGLLANIQTRVEIIESPEGCIDSLLFVDYEAVGDYQVNYLRLKKDGEEWLTWNGTPTTFHRDETVIEVPCSGATFLELYATDMNEDEVTVTKEVLYPDTVSSLE